MFAKVVIFDNQVKRESLFGKLPKPSECSEIFISHKNMLSMGGGEVKYCLERFYSGYSEGFPLSLV